MGSIRRKTVLTKREQAQKLFHLLIACERELDYKISNNFRGEFQYGAQSAIVEVIRILELTDEVKKLKKQAYRSEQLKYWKDLGDSIYAGKDKEIK
jgi:hypothetical protein